MPEQPEHLRDWFETGRIAAAPSEAVEALDAYLTSGELALISNLHFDWKAIPHVSAVHGTDDLFWELASSRLLTHDCLMLVASSGQLSVVGGTADVLWNLDTITWKEPGPAYLCGFRRDGEVQALVRALAVYDGIETIRATI